jgi:hypothetical protein
VNQSVEASYLTTLRIRDKDVAREALELFPSLFSTKFNDNEL